MTDLKSVRHDKNNSGKKMGGRNTTGCAILNRISVWLLFKLISRMKASVTFLSPKANPSKADIYTEMG